ncbi:MAG: restriction endonuclease subunit S [Paludibacteraceae bacterium]|nr:restriction endonuclease subunit S [Bacteroidales bacterium]MBR0499028.1 restriction endonuclease subunit S [Paludibacteraceae bacterium]
MTEWKEYKLGEIADVQTGPFGSQLHQSDYVDVGIPSIMPVNIGNRMDISTEKIVYITEKDAKRLSRYRVQIGDIVYSRRGDVEKCAYINEKENGWLCGTGCLRIRIDLSKADSKFIAYYLSTDDMKSWISNNAVGTTMPNLNSSILQQIPLSLPTLSNQRRIAAILSSLDDKIDLLHRENATLEQMAETLFRQWFVEEAKEDWEEGTVADLVEFNPTRKLVKGTIAPFLEMSNLSTSTYAPTYWYNRAFSSGSKFQNGDTLLARITPCLENGKTAYVDFLNENQVGWGSTEFIVMHSKLGIHSFFSYVIAKYQDFRDYAESCMSGSSGRQRVDVDNLKNYPINIPDKTAIAYFNSEIDTMVSKMNNNNKQIQTLIQTRDGLLPRLMSGEVKL